jgi:HAD superfamily hydrolase (TIGR01490 family)
MKLTLFDLDNTLLNGDSDFEWSQFLIRIGILDRKLFEVQNLAFYEQYKVGTLDIYKFLDFQLKPLSCHSRKQLDEWHQQFMRDSVMKMITQPARDLVLQHQAAGDICIIITATNSFVTSPIAKEFNIDHLIATEPEQINGEFTGHVKGMPNFREGKIVRLNHWLAERGWTLDSFSDSTFYSDSLNDLPLMSLVRHPVATNPDATLLAHALQHHWPTIYLHKPQSGS